MVKVHNIIELNTIIIFCIIQTMAQLLREKNILVGYKFGDGPSWSMRVIRTAGDILGFDSNFLLRHSFKNF